MDDVDRKIISQLQVEGRTTFQKLAEATGYTSTGVKKRVEKLLNEGTLRISAQLNLEKFHLCSAIILIEADGPETMQKLLERFKECPRVVHVFTTVGGYNMIALVVAENQETLESISMEKCSMRSEKGIRRSEFYPIRHVHYTPFITVRETLTHKSLPSQPCNVDCKSCPRFDSEECVRCPATEYYQGPL